MPVKISKPAINLREELASLRNQGGLPKEDKLYVGELITNGTFDNGTTGWFTSSSGGVTGSVVNGEYNLNNTAGGGKGVTQAFKTQIGKTYKITATARKVSGNNAFLVAAQTNWGFSDSLAYASTPSSSNVELSVTFKAVGEESYVYLRSDAVGVTVFDNISVQEVGENLVTNGTFDSGTTGWTATNSNLSVVNGKLRITNSTAGTYGDASQLVPVVAGKTYTFNIETTDGTGDLYWLVSGQGVNSGYFNGSTTDSYTFTPTSSGNVQIIARVTELGSSNVPVHSGDYADIDNVRIIEGTHPVIQSIPHGYDVKDVYIDGELAREGEAYDYQVQTDGINQWLKPTVEPTATTETVVIGVRK